MQLIPRVKQPRPRPRPRIETISIDVVQDGNGWVAYIDEYPEFSEPKSVEPSAAKALGHAMFYLSCRADLENGVRLNISQVENSS